MKLKDMAASKAGNGFIWKRGRKVLQWSAEGAKVQAGRRNCLTKQKRTCLPKYSGCERKMHT